MPPYGWRTTGLAYSENEAVQLAAFLSVDLDGVSIEHGLGVQAIGQHSLGRYTYDWGLPRILRLFRVEQIAATFFVPGYEAILHPTMIEDIAAEGHEIAGHGWQHEDPPTDLASERRNMEQTRAALRRVSGQLVIGWRCPNGRKTNHTNSLLRAVGFQYDSSEKDRSRPYTMTVDTSKLIELPTNIQVLDDAALNADQMLPPRELSKVWEREADISYERSHYLPLIIHPRALWGSCTASRIRAIESLIHHLKSKAGVRFVTGSELSAVEGPRFENA